MDISLITEAKEIAKQQKDAKKLSEEKRLKKIYDEVIRLLEDSILHKRIYNGYIIIRTRNILMKYVRESEMFKCGYCGWNYDELHICENEGKKVAAMICNEYYISCSYSDMVGEDSYFLFNFND